MAIPTAVSTGFTIAGRMRITAVIVRYRNGKMRFTLKIENATFYDGPLIKILTDLMGLSRSGHFHLR